MNNCIYNSKVHSFPQALLLQNCPHLGTDNVHKQISKYISAPNTSYFLYIFVQNRGYCVSYPSIILQHAQKMFKNSLLFAVDIFSFEFSLVWLYKQKKFPFLCNNHKMLSCLELNFKQRFMVVDMRFENWGMLLWWYLQISPNLFCRLAQIFYES